MKTLTKYPKEGVIRMSFSKGRYSMSIDLQEEMIPIIGDSGVLNIVLDALTLLNKRTCSNAKTRVKSS